MGLVIKSLKCVNKCVFRWSVQSTGRQLFKMWYVEARGIHKRRLTGKICILPSQMHFFYVIKGAWYMCSWWITGGVDLSDVWTLEGIVIQVKCMTERDKFLPWGPWVSSYSSWGVVMWLFKQLKPVLSECCIPLPAGSSKSEQKL
jgi:hypothetical protein